MPYISPSEDDEESFIRLEGVTREELIQKTIDSGVTHCVVPAIDLIL